MFFSSCLFSLEVEEYTQEKLCADVISFMDVLVSMIVLRFIPMYFLVCYCKIKWGHWPLNANSAHNRSLHAYIVFQGQVRSLNAHNRSLHANTVMDFNGTWKQWSLEKVTHVTSIGVTRSIEKKKIIWHGVSCFSWQGIGQATFIGHDWGGAVVWNLALWYPERTRYVY